MASKKGSIFERELCRIISKWWTHGKRDDVFWRTPMSGGRATVRSKKGLSTYGHHGDIQATDPIGAPLVKTCSIELKRGYSGQTFSDLLDKPYDMPSIWRDFIKQARREAREGKIPYWLLIVRRDRRDACVFFSTDLLKALQNAGPESWFESEPCPTVKLNVRLGKKYIPVFGMTLEDFLTRATPGQIKDIYKGRT